MPVRKFSETFELKQTMAQVSRVLCRTFLHSDSDSVRQSADSLSNNPVTLVPLKSVSTNLRDGTTGPAGALAFRKQNRQCEFTATACRSQRTWCPRSVNSVPIQNAPRVQYEEHFHSAPPSLTEQPYDDSPNLDALTLCDRALIFDFEFVVRSRSVPH